MLVDGGGCWWVLVGVGGCWRGDGGQRGRVPESHDFSKIAFPLSFRKKVRIVVKVMILQLFHKNSVFRLRMRVRWNSCQEDQLNCCVYKHLRAGRGNTVFVHGL